MQPTGIHLLLTYKCNASCEHCFLSCGPKRDGAMTAVEATKYLEEAKAARYINHFFVEGGEPFLLPDTLLSVVRAASERGYWIGALTNGFWATSDSSAEAVLEPLVAAGLKSLDVSTDAWHARYVAPAKAQRAAKIARQLGIESDLMFCAGGAASEKIFSLLAADGFSVFPGEVICRGRAATSVACRAGTHDWFTLDCCGATFGRRSRVHIGPFGDIHLCQGLLLGRDARKEPLAEIFSSFDPSEHPICSALTAGGPAALARFAGEYGFRPRDRYADGCQLCFEARRHLAPHFPKLLGPGELYETPELVSPVR